MHTNPAPFYIPLEDDIEETTEVDFWLISDTMLDAREAVSMLSPAAVRALSAVSL